MSDADTRLERLERLVRLRDSGALTDEEFAYEKRRVLMGAEAAPQPTSPVRPVAVERYEEPVRQRPRRSLPIGKLIAGVALASAVGAAIFINTTPSNVPGRSAPKPSAVPRKAVVPSSVAPPAAHASDLAATLRFANAGQCGFASTADALFEAMLPSKDNGDRAAAPKRVALGNLDLAVVASTESAEDVTPGGRRLKAYVRLPEGTRWNALKISRIVREHGDFPDTDDTDTRMLTFLNPAEDVQSALKNAGVSVPIAPRYREIDDSGGSCGGTMQVLPVTGGSALVCSWGC